MPKAEIFNYITEWYDYFKLSLPPQEIFDVSIEVAFNHFDRWDPYYLFGYNLTDVELTNDWMTSTFKMTDDGVTQELDPDHLETFRYVPDQDRQSYEYYVQYPGQLHKLPCGDDIDMHLVGEGYCEDVMQRIDDESKTWILDHSPELLHVNECKCNVLVSHRVTRYSRRDDDESEKVTWESKTLNVELYELFLRGDSSVEISQPIPENVKKMFDDILENRRRYEVRYDYFRLATWAALMWFTGPHGRWFRHKYIDYIYRVCAHHGMAVCYSGNFYEPHHFIIVDRPPKSCNCCGLDSYCVSSTVINGEYTQECEFHLNGHIPRVFPITCGTRVCKYTDCHYHPYHGHVNARMLMGQHGQLRKMVDQRVQRNSIDFAGNQVQYLM
jgi:hypothetical protein